MPVPLIEITVHMSIGRLKEHIGDKRNNPILIFPEG